MVLFSSFAKILHSYAFFSSFLLQRLDPLTKKVLKSKEQCIHWSSDSHLCFSTAPFFQFLFSTALFCVDRICSLLFGAKQPHKEKAEPWHIFNFKAEFTNRLSKMNWFSLVYSFEGSEVEFWETFSLLDLGWHPQLPAHLWPVRWVRLEGRSWVQHEGVASPAPLLSLAAGPSLSQGYSAYSPAKPNISSYHQAVSGAFSSIMLNSALSTRWLTLTLEW